MLIWSTKASYSSGVAEWLGVFVAGAIDIGGEGRVLFDAVDDARRHGVGREGKHLADPVLVAHREVDAENAAVAPADDVGLGDFQQIHQRHDIVGHQIVAIRAERRGCCGRGRDCPSG